MDNKKIGDFILELRKSKDMTQRELAEKLNVTDKAVSKWERGLGYPEITIIPHLAELLSVSASELLQGERASSNKEEDTMVLDVIEYAEETHKQKTLRTNVIFLMVISSIFLLSMFVCVLCNYAISKTLNWSLYVVGSEIATWLVIFPFFLLKKYRFITSLVSLTLSILPLLLLIEALCPTKNWVLPLAAPIVVISLISLWVSVILFIYTKINRYYLISFIFILFGVVVNLIINHIVNSYLNSPNGNISNVITAICNAFAGIVMIFIGFNKRKAI